MEELDLTPKAFNKNYSQNSGTANKAARPVIAKIYEHLVMFVPGILWSIHEWIDFFLYGLDYNGIIIPGTQINYWESFRIICLID